MANDARERIGALRRSHDDLAALVATLSNDALGTQSGAAEWTIARVLSHLGSGAEISRNTLRGSIEGTGAPDGSTLAPIWDRWNAMSPTEMARGFVEADELLVAEFERLDDDAIENLPVDLGFLPEPVDVATTATFRLSEHALHSWDVYVGFDSTAAVAPYAVPLLAEQMVRMVGFTSRPIGKTADVMLRATEPPQDYLLELGEAVGLRPVGDTTADAGTTLHLPAEALLRLAAGRLKPQYTPRSVSIEGELSLDDLRAVFPGY